MTIAIAINGEGMGHAARCTCLARRLQRDHRVVIWAPRSVLSFLRQNLPDVSFHHLPLLALAKRKHRICMLPTVARNAGLVLALPRVVRKLRRQLEQQGVDGVISDYEPFLSRAAIRLGLPVVTFCHQAVLDRYPDSSPEGMTARLLNRFMIPLRTSRVVSSSFFDGDVGPLIRQELLRQPLQQNGHVVVYASRSIRAELLPALAQNRGVDFRLFPDSSRDYVSELTSARAIIAPAGHQTLSEALCLNKPVLTFPQPGQNEQQLNARMAARTGRATVGNIDNAATDIALFLERLEVFPFHAADPDVRFLLRDDTERAAELIVRLLSLRYPAKRWPNRFSSPIGAAASF